MELNQLYRLEKTFKKYPKVKEKFDELEEFCKKYILPFKHPGNQPTFGRSYDYSVLSGADEIDFKDKVICDLGARCGYWGIYLSQVAKRVDISDYFQEWDTGLENGLYTFEDEKKWVSEISSRIGTSEKINVHHQDITNITYKDNSYDIVLCTSVIEHMYPQRQDKRGYYCGDIAGMKEIERICKPGGYVLMSTDMSPTPTKELPKTSIDRWWSGVYWYNETELFKRIINSTSLELIGPYDFSFDNPDNTCVTKHLNQVKSSPVILMFKKPY